MSMSILLLIMDNWILSDKVNKSVLTNNKLSYMYSMYRVYQDEHYFSYISSKFFSEADFG